METASKVKRSENTQHRQAVQSPIVHATNEYDRFMYDRNKSEHKVLELMGRIEGHDMLMLYPIIVDPNFGVLDGNIRLEAARRLGKYIYYFISSEMKPQDIPMASHEFKGNSTQLPEILQLYVQKGYPEYKKLKSFVDRTGFPIYAAIGLLTGSSAQPGRTIVNSFKDGSYVVTHADTAMKIYSMLNDFAQYLPKDIIRQRVFINAVSTLATYVSPDGHIYDHKRMLNKLRQAAGLITNTTKKGAYLKMFADVYEYKERNKSAANCPSFRDSIA